jgi:hypothetical protein
LALSLLLLRPGSLIAQSSDTHPLAQTINEKGRVLLISGDLQSRYTSRAVAAGPCSLALVTIDDSQVMRQEDSTMIDLSRVAIDEPPRPFMDSTQAWIVRLETFDGAATFPAVVSTMFKSTPLDRTIKPRQASSAAVFTDTRESADVIASAVASAARGCGSQRKSSAARAAEEARRAPTADERRLRSQCQQLVRAALKSPATAAFGADSLTNVFVTENTTALVMGKVSAQNGLGATLTKSFSCSFKRSDGLWVPEGTPLLF